MLVLAAAAVMSGCASLPGGEEESAGARERGPAMVLHFVRIRSGLPDEEAFAVLRQREPHFRDVPGLLQKIYGRDAETGDLCGIYIFESQASLDDFRQSKLARTIRDAYHVESARIERYDVLFTLWPGIRTD